MTDAPIRDHDLNELEDGNRYLVFNLGTEKFGVPLLDVREVLQYQEPKFIPNMPPHWSGVINVRGNVVGVLDLRLRLGMSNKNDARTALLVCETDSGRYASIVDSVEAVTAIAEEEIDRKPPVKTGYAGQYIRGIAKHRDRLVLLIHLQGILSEGGSEESSKPAERASA